MRYAIWAVMMLCGVVFNAESLPKDMNQIKTLTVEHAKALAEYDGALSLNGRTTPSDEAAKALRTHKEIVLPEKFREPPVRLLAALWPARVIGEPRGAVAWSMANTATVFESMPVARKNFPVGSRATLRGVLPRIGSCFWWLAPFPRTRSHAGR